MSFAGLDGAHQGFRIRHAHHQHRPGRRIGRDDRAIVIEVRRKKSTLFLLLDGAPLSEPGTPRDRDEAGLMIALPLLGREISAVVWGQCEKPGAPARDHADGGLSHPTEHDARMRVYHHTRSGFSTS